MRTKAITVVPLFMLILLNPASSDAVTHSSPTNHSTASPSPLVTSTKAQDLTTSTLNESIHRHTNTTAEAEIITIPLSTSPASQQTTTASSSTNRVWLVPILFAIVLLMAFVGCFHSMRKHQLGETSSAGRLLMGMRERLRTGIGNLENWLGVRLWPGGTRGRKDDVEESQVEEEGQQGHDGGEGGSGGVSNEEKQEHKEEDSDTSDDYSSMEGDDLRERAIARQKEEERNKDEEDTSSASEGDPNAEEEKNGGSEKMALVNSPKEDDENMKLCDVTAL